MATQNFGIAGPGLSAHAIATRCLSTAEQQPHSDSTIRSRVTRPNLLGTLRDISDECPVRLDAERRECRPDAGLVWGTKAANGARCRVKSGRAKQFRDRARRGGARVGGCGGWSGRRIVQALHGDGSAKAISAARDGLDVPRILGIVMKRLANLSNGHAEAVVGLDERVLGQRRWRVSSRVTISPGRSTRRTSNRNGRFCNRTRVPLRVRLPSTGSSSKRADGTQLLPN